MVTYKYRWGYIHENLEAGTIKAQVGSIVRLNCCSVHAAKCWITRNKKFLDIELPKTNKEK